MPLDMFTAVSMGCTAEAVRYHLQGAEWRTRLDVLTCTDDYWNLVAR